MPLYKCEGCRGEFVGEEAGGTAEDNARAMGVRPDQMARVCADCYVRIMEYIAAQQPSN